MRYLEMGLIFAALGFVAANTAISLLIILLWRALRPSRLRASSLFLMRMAPAIGSVGLVLGVVLPAFLAFEPRGTTERAGPALVVFGIVALALVGAGVYRAIASWLATRRLERAWRSAAVGGVQVGVPVCAYRVVSELPLAALVGVFRPRLFVSDGFLDALSAEERQAVIDHEAGHLLSLDNLKRTLMRLAPDWLSLTAAGQELESAWAIAAEEEADDYAAGPLRSCSLDLAGALLKASRLTPMRCAPVSNFYDGATIARRVARLLQDPTAAGGPARPLVPRSVWIPALLGVGALLAAPALRGAYTVTEAAIRLLQ